VGRRQPGPQAGVLRNRLGADCRARSLTAAQRAKIAGSSTNVGWSG
jgi:hypothetical protein